MNGPENDSYRDFDTGEPDGERDTVRILPDDTDGEASASIQPVRPGTLYTHQPGPARPARSSLKPYDSTPISPTPRSAAQARHIETAPSEAPTYVPPASPDNGPAVVRVRRGPSACAILAGTFALLALSCALLAFGTLQGGLNGLGKLGGLIPNFGGMLVTTPTVTIDTSRPTVIDQVRALNKLETVHYQLEKVVSGKSSGPLPDFLTSDKILLVAHGEVVGGVDLSKLTPGDITVISDSVLINLPPPEILYSKLDNDKTYVYDRQTGVFNKPDPNLESQMRQAAEKAIIDAAKEDNILDKARVNAEQVIRTLVSGLGYKDVRFKEQP